MTVLHTRAEAIRAVRRRFEGKAFAWGKYDCVRMAAAHLQALGYKPGLSRGGPYTTERGAKLALKRAGYDSTEAALDGLGLFRIPYAHAVQGDVLGVLAEGGWTGLAIQMADRRILAFHPEARTCIVCLPPNIETVTAVWRCPPVGATRKQRAA